MPMQSSNGSDLQGFR